MKLYKRVARVILWGNKYHSEAFYKKYGYRTVLGLGGWLLGPQFIGICLGVVGAVLSLYLLVALGVFEADFSDQTFLIFMIGGAVVGSGVALFVTLKRTEKLM